ncbi:hypothetical protein BLNAU_11050 [Blattamonas nauphoetae]|uniref:Uncharacterized protein n=1 Tax=Blattamonas nauphoetae TaxID=2049346 RepID=A0ABQ9XNI3_9EUKA|nr:hypothetical protein BLNAU_11050 [Blattamonas nauphoetae]
MCTSFQLLHFTFHSPLRWMGAVFFACRPSSFSQHHPFLLSAIPDIKLFYKLHFTEITSPITPQPYISTSLSHPSQRSVPIHPLHSSNNCDGCLDRFGILNRHFTIQRVGDRSF